MFRTTLITMSSLALILFTSCGSNSDGTYEALVADYGAQVEQMKSLNADHAEAVAASTDLTVLLSEEDTHQGEMEAVMDEMRTTATQLEGCSMMEDMDMSGMMTDVESQMQAHQSNMEAAPDLESAQQEELAHQEAMDEMLSQMEEDYDAMYGMSGMSGMGC